MTRLLSALALFALLSPLIGCEECLESADETVDVGAEDVAYAIGGADPAASCEALCLDYGYNSVDKCETLKVQDDGSVTVHCIGEPICK